MAIDTFIWFVEQAGMQAPVGETQDAAFKDKGQGLGGDKNAAFELKDWSFKVSNKSTIGSATGGAGGGKAEFGEFTISKLVDSASTDFFRNCVAGAHYLKVCLACRKAGGDPSSAGLPYLIYTFSTVFTTEVSWKHSDDGPTEDITFVYGSVKIDYLPQKPDGTLDTSKKKTQGWSVITNKAL